MPRSKTKPSAQTALKNSEQFSHRAPLDNAIDFLIGKMPPSGRPQAEKVDAHTIPVDAKTPTLKKVGVHSEKSGRPQNDRHRAGKTRIHFRMEDEQARAIKVFCAEKGIDLQEFFILAGVHFMEHVDAHKNLLVDAKTPHDDLMMWKTTDDIIIMYQKHTGNRWKTTDDQLGRTFNDVDARIVEIGLLTALFRVQLKRINSFKYFVPSIQEAIEMVTQARMTESSLDEYLKYARGKLRQLRQGK